VDERLRFIAACSESEESIAELCRRFGISRKTGYKWLDRYDAAGPPGLLDRPPVAHAHPASTPLEIVDALVAARKAHPTWGPRKLRSWLSERDARSWPAPSTIGELLKRHGLVRPRRRRPRMPLAHNPVERGLAPNQVWCTDFKGHFALGDRSRCFPLTMSDEASRYLLRCEGLTSQRHELVMPQFEMAFREFGLPDAIRSDNGAPFASLAPGGLSKLSVWWIRLGIRPLRIEPGEPQQNGVHERMHRTLKSEATRPPARDLVEQQRSFDRFRHEFNDERPHEALGQKPPARVYTLSRRSMPDAPREPEYGEGFEVRHCNFNGIANLHGLTVNLSVTLARALIAMREIADGRCEVRYGPVVLGWLDRTSGKPRFERA
jgi:transposase InsO family protein